MRKLQEEGLRGQLFHAKRGRVAAYLGRNSCGKHEGFDIVSLNQNKRLICDWGN